jgi:hypothetical protein
MRISTSPVRFAPSLAPWLTPSHGPRLVSGLALGLVPLIALGALVAPARAEHKAADQRERVAAAAAAAVRTDHGRSPTSLTTGELGLTGARPRKDVFLEPSEISAEVRPYGPDIERCYLDRLGDVRRAGRLDLTFVIGRDGYVVSLDATAPGLPAKTVKQVSACIREELDPIHFPARRSDTTAIVPYLFQHTNTPGGGPQLSCWNPQGCH